MPDKKALWKVLEHIKGTFRDAQKGRLEGLADILTKTAPLDIVRNFGLLFVPTTEKSPEEASIWINKEMEKAMEEIIKSKLPPWITAPTVAMIVALSIAQSIGNASSIMAERNIHQNMRKAIRPLLLDAGSVINAERRDILDTDAVNEILGRLGYKNVDIDVLKQLAKYVPGAGDIISFAVREAYDDGIAGTFGTDDNLNSVLEATKKDRLAAGFTDDQFRKFWRSHWDLPGINQMLEAFQRGFISAKELDTFLRIKDVMPYFRGVITKIAYNPITRVDVRRIHKLGLLDDTDLVRRYRDRGFSPEDAELMAAWTIENNKDPEESEQTQKDKDKAKERDLTKADIIASYKSGILDSDQSKPLLLSLGYSQNEVDLLVARVDFNKTQKLTDKLIDGYHDTYVKGLIDVAEIKKLLQSIPITAEEIAQLITLWDIERMSKLDMPTKAEILRWFKKKYIDEVKTRELLLAIGTQEQYLDFYIKDAQT